jgi:hypothetical protein
VKQDDLLAVDHVTRSYIGETYNLMYRKTHKWYYLNQQQPNEVLLMKMFDSKDDVQAGCECAAYINESL